ncbi:protein SYS1 homolog [Symsagittifera roscoffensis]|uniref:protein SYS1 homolog n=1 Tax=Symsagittifera roscoffensis TaxID=84072 RepID=UPI00307BB979
MILICRRHNLIVASVIRDISQSVSNMGTVRFRSSSFDPKLLISQIISMQCLYYLFTCTLLLSLSLAFPQHGISLQHILSYRAVGLSSVSERINSCLFVINSLFMALSIWLLVGRSKLCTDFSFTLLLYHWIISSLYPSSWAHIPATWSWYLLHIVCALLTTVLAEYLCMRTEMRAVPIGGGGTSTSNITQNSSTASTAMQNSGDTSSMTEGGGAESQV